MKGIACNEAVKKKVMMTPKKETKTKKARTFNRHNKISMPSSMSAITHRPRATLPAPVILPTVKPRL